MMAITYLEAQQQLSNLEANQGSLSAAQKLANIQTLVKQLSARVGRTRLQCAAC